MHQTANAAGLGDTLYALYETDPKYIHEKRRRHGSVRLARYAAAAGICAPGRASRLTLDRTQAVAGGFTCYLSLNTGDLTELNLAYPLVTLRASRDASTSTDAFRLYLKRTSLSAYVLGIAATNTTPTTTQDQTFSVTANTDYHLAFRWDGTVLRLTDNTTTKTVTPGGSFTGPYYIDIAGDKFTTAKPKAEHPVIANFSFDPTYIADLSNIGVRSPGGMDYYWRLDGADGGSILAANTGTAFFLGYPAAPQLVSSALQFSSESGALQIEHTTDFDRYWQTALRSVGQESLTFYLKGTRGQESARDVVLLDYGDLAKIVLLNTNYIRFTYNGVTVTDATTQITAGTAFEIYAGRDGANVVLQVASTQGTATAPAVPYLDFARITNIYVGSDEDPAPDTRYLGNLTKFALWPFATRRDVGSDTAAFYFDFTGTTVEDSSLNRVPAIQTPHTAESGEPLFRPGPIDDAEFVAVEGGSIIGAAGPRTYDNSLRKQFGSDTAGFRLGDYAFLTSGDRAHVVNHRISRTRPLGLPKPGADVTAQAVGTGSLDGVYAYGYQFESSEGTVGPMKRLTPVLAADGARVILGSSDGAENTVGTELDESYGTNFEAADTPGGDRFKIGWDGAPAAGTYTAEVRARLKDLDPGDLKEKVHHRGVEAVDGAYTTDTLYFSTDIGTHSFNVNANWTVQTVFQYHSPRDFTNAMTGWGLWGLGKTDRLTTGVGFPSYCQDFIAYFLDGDNDAGGLVSNYYTTTEGLGAHYGDGTRPRLVVGVPRQERRESWYNIGRRLGLNYALLTFTDATEPDWTEGSTYDVVFQRSGPALKVYYRNLTAGETAYTEIVGKTMDTLDSYTNGSGKTVPAKSSYTGATLFTGYAPKTDARDFHFGTGQDYHLSDLPFITSAGQVRQEDYSAGAPFTNYGTLDTNTNQVKPAPGGTNGWIPFHFRVWNRVLAIPDLERDGLDRSAALDGEPLNYGIYIDLGCVIEVETAQTDKLTDKASGMIWYAKNETGTGASRVPSAETLVFTEPGTAALRATKYPIALFATDGAAFSAAELKLFVSPYGDGSYTLQSQANGAFNLRTRIWSVLTTDPRTTKLIGDFPSFVSPFDQFKWFSLGLVIKADGSDRWVGADSLAINGNTIFKGTIGATEDEAILAAEFDAASSNYWITLAGFANEATVAFETNISEFRVWAVGEGPDVQEGTDFRYLTGRVSENELVNLLTYIKFQPDDESGGVIEDYGTLDNGAIEVGNADLVDTRTGVGPGDDPAPKVAFPGAPFEDIVAIRIARSIGIAVNDPEDEQEVQNALNAARGVQLTALARIPIGSTHYVDAAPDIALGAAVPFDSGQTPTEVSTIFTWQGHLGLATGDYDIWFSEGGATGWESFPNWLRHRVPITTGGGPITGAVEAGGVLYIMGAEWAVAVSGTPSSPEFTTIGAGAGATAARCVTAYANHAFCYNGTLWMLMAGAPPVNVGREVHDLLPAAANARLSTSTTLASLFLIDESSGLTLRYHFPTQRWSVEDRDAAACGDTAAGVDAWVSTVGAVAQGNTAVYGDDVNALTSTDKVGAVSGNTITVASGTVDAPTGLRCTIENVDDGTTIEARIVSLSGTPSAIVFDDLTGVSGQVTIYFGAGEEGMLIDPGVLDLGEDDARASHRQLIHLLQGTGWYHGRLSATQPGDPSDRSALEYTSVSTSDERKGDGSLMGRFQRITLRNRIPEAARVTYFEFAR